MDLLGAALPNIMFIVGILAVGLGLGIELKVVSLNKEIDKKGRVGAFVAGLVLIGASLALYLNPSLTNRDQAPKAEANAAVVAAQPPQAAASVPTATQAAIVAPPAQAPVPTQAPAPVPTQAPTPTQVPAPAPTVAAPSVLVPDLHDKDDKGARDTLTKAGLKALKVERCTGTDKGDPKTKKNRVLCQNPPADQPVAAGTTVEYVLTKK